MFNFQDAFSRNIGWVTQAELDSLRYKTVAIAGAGGVGGEHLVTLARLGIGCFKIADFDFFELHNFNRQAGAFISTIGDQKTDVMKDIALDINPDADIQVFDEGINEGNVDAFLDGVDVYVDGLDFFALKARKLVFQKCQDKGIPFVTAAPVGMGCAFLSFLPGGMTFEEYFRFGDAKTEEEEYIKFYIGLCPSGLQRGYLVEPDVVDLINRKLPSTPMGIKLSSGIACTNVLKILLKRGGVVAAPYGLHFDAYKNKIKRTWRPHGNRNLLQRLMFYFAGRQLLDTE